MASREQRGNREAKKPKKDKPKAAATPTAFAATVAKTAAAQPKKK